MVGLDNAVNKKVTITAGTAFPEGVNLYYRMEGSEGPERWTPLSGKTEFSVDLVGTIYCIGIQCGIAPEEGSPVVAENVTVNSEDLPKIELADKVTVTSVNSLDYYKEGVITKPDWNINSENSTIFGDVNTKVDYFVDLGEYDELRIYQTTGDPVRTFFVNGSAVETINTTSAIPAVWTNDEYYCIDLNAIKEAYGEAKLIAIKASAYNTKATVSAVYAVITGNTCDYVIKGDARCGLMTDEVQAVLDDASVTSIDATRLSNASGLLLNTANPNCLIVANAEGLSNTQNVIIGTTCANLVLTDKKPFKAPFSFNATAATLNREVSNGSFATICAPFAISGATGTFYQPSELTSEGQLNFATEATPAAGKPYLFKASADVTAFTGSGAVVAEPIDNGVGAVMKGTFSQIAKVDEGSYILSGSSLYKVDSDVTLAPFRAYFEVPAVAPARINLHFDDVTTGIEAVNSLMNNVEGYYNLSGQRVAQPTKGLYIVNGKKIIVK